MTNLKWQIHAETSISQALMWVIIWKLFGGWVGFLALFFILGNIFTMWWSVKQLPRKYLTPNQND